MAELEKPIIIKKINKIEGGHHGGAWKVAYADFVTAMMAFFLLLWLLSSAAEETLDGIADYFAPTIGLKDAVGIGFDGGIAAIEGKNRADTAPPGVVIGSTPQGQIPQPSEKQALIESTEEANLFEKAQEDIKRAFEENPNLNEFADNIIVEQTPEGLKIQVIDSDKNSMFEPGTANLSAFGRTMLAEMSKVINVMPNFISITGHTDGVPFNKNGYSNWELSMDRANSARRYLLKIGMSSQRVSKMQGRADRDPLLPIDPDNARNRRIEIILLKGSHMFVPMELMPASRDLLSVPKVRNLKPAPITEGDATPAAQGSPAEAAPASNQEAADALQ